MFVLIEQIKQIVVSLKNKGLAKEANAVEWLLEAYTIEMGNRDTVVATADQVIDMIKTRKPQTVIIEKIDKLIKQAKKVIQ